MICSPAVIARDRADGAYTYDVSFPDLGGYLTFGNTTEVI